MIEIWLLAFYCDRYDSETKNFILVILILVLSFEMLNLWKKGFSY